MSANLPASDSTPQYEPGGGRILLIVGLIISTALGGMAWSFLSRLNAPRDAPAIKSRYLPPSQKQEAPAAGVKTDSAAVPPAPTFPAQR
jgi:hypothetical protein